MSKPVEIGRPLRLPVEIAAGKLHSFAEKTLAMLNKMAGEPEGETRICFGGRVITIQWQSFIPDKGAKMQLPS